MRTFSDSKLKSDERNQLNVPKNLEKDIWHAQVRFGEKFCFEVSMGHLRSFGGHLVTQNSNVIGAIDSVSKKKKKKI